VDDQLKYAEKCKNYLALDAVLFIPVLYKARLCNHSICPCYAR